MPTYKPIVKYADSQFTSGEIHEPDIALLNPEVMDRFTKYAKALKAVAPKAKDFLYFSCVMMHSAEAALIDQKTGAPLLGKDGKPIAAKWDINPKTGSWKWVCTDPNLKPYKNNNGDIFPETELKKAYRQWVEKPLCQDHQSSTVDGMRGLIIDTYWDDKHKRVIALCALDRKNYPELARKIEGRYATNVSMGTAVGRSICYDCGNVARTEAEYCQCVRGRRTYGEINIELSPIELSLVVTGADPAAKLRDIIASLNTYSMKKQERIEELQRAGCVTPGELDNLRAELAVLRRQLQEVSMIRSAALDPSHGAVLRNLLDIISNPATSAETKDLANRQMKELLGGQATPAGIASMEAEDGASNEGTAVEKAEDNPEGGQMAEDVEPPYGLAGNKAMTGGRGTFTQDPESGGPPPWSLDGRETRLASGSLETQIAAVMRRLDDMQGALQSIRAANRTPQKEEKDMSDLKERARARRAAFDKKAYHQGGGGVNDPQTYPKEEADKIRDTQDKQMVGEGMEPGSDGLAGNDLAIKQKLSRAELEERRMRRHGLLARADAETFTLKDGTKVSITKGADGKPVVQAVEDGIEAKAYFQGGGGVNEPQTYPKEEADKIRDTQDKQMVGEGMEPGSDGLAGDDLALKKKLLRAALSARFIKVYANKDKTDVDRARSRWEVYAGDKELFKALGGQIYTEAQLADDDHWMYLSSADYGQRILAEIRANGLEKTAYAMTGMVVTAQDPMPPAPMAPPMPPAAAEPPAEPPKGEEKPGAETVKNRVDEALAAVEKALGDLKEVLKEEGDSKEGGKEELPPIEIGEAKTASDLRAALDDSGDELAILSEVLGKRIEAGMLTGTEMDELLKLAAESLEASAEIRREASLLVQAKKGEMPEGLKKALEEKEGKKDEKDEDKKEDKKDKKEDKKDKKDEKDEDKKDKKEDKKDKDEKDEKKSEAELVLEKMLKARAAKRRELVRLATEAEEHKELEEEEHEIHEDMEEGLEDLGDLVQELGEVDEKEMAGDDVQYADEDALVAELLAELDQEPAEELEKSALASRRAWRERMAAEVGSKYQLKLEPATDMDTDMVPKAHPQRSTDLGGLDTKPSEEGARIEGIDEIKAKIMKQVETLPKVREAVAKLGDMLKAGKLAAADLANDAKLKALAVDPEAAKYWKQYFGEGDPASKQFGQDLTKEFAQKKAAAEAETYRLKLRRAVDLALDMQEKGACSKGREAMNRQVDELMKLDDAGFEAFKRAAQHLTTPTKTAGKAEPAILVGLNEGADESATLANQLDRLWVPKRK